MLRVIAGLAIALLPVAAWGYARATVAGEGGGLDLDDLPPEQLPETLPELTFMENIVGADKSTRGERNNNPGNLRLSAAAWQGKMAGKDPAFEVFSAPEFGIRAMAKTLKAYQDRGLKTVGQIIGTWAPSTENNTAAYVRAVANELRVRADEPLDFRDPERLQKLITAIIRHENGRVIYSASTIAAGISLA